MEITRPDAAAGQESKVAAVSATAATGTAGPSNVATPALTEEPETRAAGPRKTVPAAIPLDMPTQAPDAESRPPVEPPASDLPASTPLMPPAEPSPGYTLPSDLSDWPNRVRYAVQPGDTLAVIATSFDTTMSAIIALNDLTDPTYVFADDLLAIPVGYAQEVHLAPVDPATALPGWQRTRHGRPGSAAGRQDRAGPLAGC